MRGFGCALFYGGECVVPDYEKIYYQLFARVADATEALEQGDTEQALEILIAAQQEAEEACIR